MSGEPFEVVLRLLIEAARAGEILIVAYNGGSQPGTLREVAPIKVDEHFLIAYDVATAQNKSFDLKKLEIRESFESGNRYEPGKVTTPKLRFTSVAAVAETYRDALSGWTMESTEDHLNLYETFRNGKTRKTPTVSLSHVPLTHDAFVDDVGQGVQTVARPSRRPFHVWSQTLQSTRTFQNLDSAVKLFLKEAGIQ